MKNYLFLSAMLIAVMLFSCTDEDKPIGATEITVAPEDLNVSLGQAEGTEFVSVKYDAGVYNIDTDSPGWCTAQRTGNGMQVLGINITTTANDKALSRIAKITLSAKNSESVVITVSQSGTAPALSVAETQILIKSTLTFTLAVTTNVDEVNFDLPAWITLDADAPAPSEGTHAFTVEALPGGVESRNGDIVVKATGATSVTVPVTQQKPAETTLPQAPDIPEPTFVAALVDMSFKQGGYVNNATATEYFVLSAPGSGGAPTSLFNSTLNSYVASYPTEDANIFYKIDYAASEINTSPAGPKYLQNKFTFEAYLKVTNVGQGKWVRPISSIDTKNGGNQGFGLDIDNSDLAQFLIAKHNGWSSPFAGQFTVAADQYNHVVFTVDRNDTKKINCYLNGAKQGDAVDYIADWLDLSWGTKRWIGLGGNPGNGDDISDPMTGEIVFFRLYSEAITEAQAAARYAGITARAGFSNVDDLNTMITVTLPAKQQEAITTDLSKAITSAIDMGWSLMTNLEVSQEKIGEFLDYADKLLSYE